MNAKEYLKQTDYKNKHIKSLEVDLEEMRTLLNSVSSVRYDDDRVKSGTRNTDAPFVKSLERINEMEQKIERAKEELLLFKLTISDAIDLIEDVDERALLRARYVNGKGWSTIAKQMNFSIRSVHRLHSLALQHFQVPN